MIVGTAGHVHHGKTSLVRALTGVETDRLKEEKARGISIDLGFAYVPVPGGGRLGFVDVPGHERFVHTMLAGAAGIDLALLVVAADDGPMPQTREHLAILDLLGVSRGIVALTKADLVDAEGLLAAEIAVEDALAGTALAGSSVLAVSNATGAGIDALRAALFAAASVAGMRDTGRLFRLAIDRSFTLGGTGTVVTGTVLSGRVAPGDAVVLSPSGLPAQIRSVHAQNEAAPESRAGDRCALNIAGDGIGRDAAARGDVALDPSLHAPTMRIDAELRLLPTEPKPIGAWMPAFLHHGAREVAARLVPLGAVPLGPGDTGFVQLVLDAPIAAASGDRFVLRDTSQTRTIGGGRLLDLRPPSRKRGTPERLAQLAAQAAPTDGAALAGLLGTPPFHVDLAAFGRDRALSREAVQILARDLGLVHIPLAGGGLAAFAAGPWTGIVEALSAALAAHHEAHPDLMGIGIERLRVALEPRLPVPLFRAVLARLAAHGTVAIEGAWVRLPTHTVRLAPLDEERWAAIEPLLGGTERFRPPRIRDLAATLGIAETDIRRLMKLVGRLGRVDEVAHDHFFLRATVAEMVGIATRLASLAPETEFTASQFRDQVENGRKVAIQILDFFDRHGVTLRRGDLRRINRHRLDLFGPPEGPDGREASPVGRPDF